MKKWLLFLSLYTCLCLALGACGDSPHAAPAGGAASAGSAAPAESTPASPTPQAVKTLRVVGGADSGRLLAEVDGGPGAVYNVPDGADGLVPGALVDVAWDGEVLETYPARFAGDVTVEALPDGFDDRCRLYLDVLEDLWAVDEGLNGNITELGVDLSETTLSESERSAVSWLFAQNHGLTPIEGTWEELKERGCITGEPLPGGGDAKFWQWEDGCLFAIAEKEPEDAQAGGGTVAFDASKWRSGLGAYYFCDCAARARDGVWGAYTVGSEAIS